MRTYDSKYGYDHTALEDMTARILEVKASAEAGRVRLVVQEKGKTRTHGVIDIAMKHGRDLEEKQTYRFKVMEKDDSRNPGFQRKKSAEFKAFRCDEAPELYTPGMETQMRMNRFGGNSSTTKSSRVKF